MDRGQSYDVVIIGSGFGGAVSACRLAQAGRKVLVLERGRRWTPSTYPRDEKDPFLWHQEMPHRFSGWADVRGFSPFSHMFVVAGAGVGGGSLIYANVSVEAEPDAFEDDRWPPEITHSTLKPYYDEVGRMLDVRVVPRNQWSERTRLMQQAANARGWGGRFRTLPLAVTFSDAWDPQRPDAQFQSFRNQHGRWQGTCIHCGNCDVGCQVSAKNTLDLNYLAVAENNGAEIRPLHLVDKLRPVPDGWEVTFRRIIPDCGKTVPGKVTASRVIVAAGSIGSTELLLRCRDEHKTLPGLSDRLGHGWAHNGDFVTPAFYKGRKPDVSPSHGVTISAAIDLLDGRESGGQKLFVEDGGIPNLAGNFFQRHLAGAPSWKVRALWRYLRRVFDDGDPLETMMPWFGQAVDPGDGQFYLGRKWLAPWRRTLRLNWSYKESEAVIGAMIRAHTELSEATGGRVVNNPLWSKAHTLITPHPLGGCNMGVDRAHGVVDAAGKVFGYDGLYVMDGAIVPRPLGLNPSRTIAALAERSVARLLREPE